MKGNDQHENDIRSILIQFTECNGKTFDCIDPNLQNDKFEQESSLDFKPMAACNDNNIKFLLKMRAKINFRIKIAEMMLKRLISQSTKV